VTRRRGDLGSESELSEPCRILVTGATGFVGRALVRRLISNGRRPRVTSRTPASALRLFGAHAEVVSADWVTGRNTASVGEGIQIAYYLVHSMGTRSDFAEADRTAASRFAAAMARSGVERIIYLGGLGEDGSALSPHLASRREVEVLLRQGSVPVTTLRAAIILGAGGSSFEMLVQLVEKLPVMICPRWVETLCQPIALEELLGYLEGCSRLNEVIGQTYDVGGPEVLSYRTMMYRVGDRIGRRPRLIVVPVLTPSLSAHWVGFITLVSSDVARPLVEGMKNPVVCRDERMAQLVPGHRYGFDEALNIALQARRPAARR
jgi:uncharacterized protein YbjT (DUF2867 family)